MAQPSCVIRAARKVDLPAIAGIHMASWRDAYKGLVPEAALLRRSLADCLAGWRSGFAEHAADITVAASQDGRIHGFCCAGPVIDAVRSAPFEFEIHGLHVAPSSRRNGIGASLLRQALAQASAREGSSSAIVWTLADLALSRRFYEREGGKPVKSGVCTLDGIALPEIAYGWTNLTCFADSTDSRPEFCRTIFPLPRG
jgi:ribosomal protein S18 acetylase RimI-like enzyme